MPHEAVSLLRSDRKFDYQKINSSNTTQLSNNGQTTSKSNHCLVCIMYFQFISTCMDTYVSNWILLILIY